MSRPSPSRSAARLPLFDRAGGPDLSHEQAAERRCGGPVAGVDEAGRGPWAGPVVTAAVILDPERIPAGLDDSKQLTEAARETLFEQICAGHSVGAAFASAEQIDALNIRAATLWAMARAVAGLGLSPAHVLIDGRDVPPGLDCAGTALVKGDGRSLSIAAASIVAKVLRDRLMVKLAETCPGYGFERHKGYGTAGHARALASLGPSVHHRRSFEPIKSLVGFVRSSPDQDDVPARNKVTVAPWID